MLRYSKCFLFTNRYDFPSPWWDNISKDAKDLVQGLLTVDPKKRLTAKQVKAPSSCEDMFIRDSAGFVNMRRRCG